MTLNQFLDVAYATLVQEYRRLGSSLVEALELTREYAAGGHKKPVTAGGSTGGRLTPEEVKSAMNQLTPEELANERAMAVFQQAMEGVSFG